MKPERRMVRNIARLPLMLKQAKRSASLRCHSRMASPANPQRSTRRRSGAFQDDFARAANWFRNGILAQTDTPATAETPAAAQTAADDDDGFDLGWLGLLGLAGLAGLTRRREPVVHRTTTTAGTPRV